jgi:hypothetical protein
VTPTDYEQAGSCILGTPLANGPTPLRGLACRSRSQQALSAVGCWLGGQAVNEQLRAACWSVFEVYRAALAAGAGEVQAAGLLYLLLFCRS